MSRRRRLEPTEDWEQLVPLFRWPEQREYELIRPIVLFGGSTSKRAQQTGTAERTLYRKATRFETEGIKGLFATPKAKYRRLPPLLRRLVVDLKAEHPPMNLGEIANICYVQTGRKPSKRTIKQVLDEEPIPLRLLRRYSPYHQMPEALERRTAVVRLHAEGWSVTSIASYLKTTRQSVYQVLKRWIEEGEEGLKDRPRGRPKGVRKVDLRAMNEVRKLQENPELGEFRIHAALKQIGINLSPRTCGRILALNRKLYALDKPPPGSKHKPLRRRCPLLPKDAINTGQQMSATWTS